MKHQSNGILLLKLELDNNDIKIYKIFYKTFNFEVYCFCNIFKVNYDKTLDKSIPHENDKNYTEYVLVGGFDNYKKKGLIKLYKIIYNKDIKKIELEYIQDIQIDKVKNKNNKYFKGFKGPITCITQAIDEKILISSFDENICLFYESFEKIENMEEKKKNIFIKIR